MCLSTAASILFVDRYQNVGRQLLLNVDFSKELSRWKTQKPSSGVIIVRNNQLTLTSYDAEKSIQVFQIIQTGLYGKKFRLRATLASKDVIQGERKWNKARLLLVQYIDEEPQWTLLHVLAALEGTRAWHRYNKVFSLSPECSELRVIAQMSRCSGKFFVSDLSLHEVEEANAYAWLKWLIRAAWILFVVALFVPGFKRGNSTLIKICIVLTVAGIVAGTTMPGEMKNKLKEDIRQEVNAHTEPVTQAKEKVMNTVQYEFISMGITKIAHFCLFALLALMLLLNYPAHPIWFVLLELLMLACATELMQFYVDGRSPLVTDVMIDMAGGVVGGIAGSFLSGKRSMIC